MFAIDHPQTIKQAYQDIQVGDDPWVAIGDFSHDWYGNYPSNEERTALVAEPIGILVEPLEQRQWAAFCAARVEYLCQQAGIPVPSWVESSVYMLSEEEAFYTSPLAYKPRVRERLRSEAPKPFQKRKVFCSARIYANKYEETPTTHRQTASPYRASRCTSKR